MRKKKIAKKLFIALFQQRQTDLYDMKLTIRFHVHEVGF